MTTPPYSELVAAVRREGEAIVAAGRLGLDAAVPACDGWTVRDLLAHVGRVFHRPSQLLAERATTSLPRPPEMPADADPVAYVSDALDELVDALASTEAEAPVWNWAPGEPDVALFWARRMAHEASVHRYDAQRAHGMAQPVDAELAPDGLDELFDVLVPLVVERDKTEPPAGTFLLVATDGGEWPLQVGPAGVQRLETLKEPDVVVRGTASALLLACYGRVRWTSLECEGDTGLLDAWSAAVRF